MSLTLCYTALSPFCRKVRMAMEHKGLEFALAPGGYASFAQDAVFIVGKSDAKRDWPYVQPGPIDAWAGSRPHSFSIVFGTRQTETAESKACKLVFDLPDTHSQTPPKLNVEINGRIFDRQLPAGAGEASIEGNPAMGKPYHFEIEFPSAVLKDGDNLVSIASVEAQVTASNDGDFFLCHSDSGNEQVANRRLTFVYFLHREPRQFDGGELRIHDARLEAGEYASEGSYQSIVPQQNQIVFFPCELLHEITPVKCPAGQFADSRFTMNGWLHH